jgi:hypothetical protein
MVILGASLMVSSCAKVTQKEREQRAIKGYIKGSGSFYKRRLLFCGRKPKKSFKIP